MKRTELAKWLRATRKMVERLECWQTIRSEDNERMITVYSENNLGLPNEAVNVHVGAVNSSAIVVFRISLTDKK